MTNDRTGTSFLIETYEGQESPEEMAILTYSLVGVVNALDKVYGNGLWRSGFMEVQLATFDSVLQYEETIVMSEGVL